jgi:lipopolysaccharide transport system permease protein
MSRPADSSGTEPLPEVFYSARSALSNPRTLARELARQLEMSGYLAWRFAVRDITARYRQTLLGILWAFLPVIATTGLFIFLNKSRLMNVGEPTIPYPVYAFLGALFWMLFTESITVPMATVVAAKGMIAKVQFPREALLLSAGLQIAFDFAIKLVIGIVVIFASGMTPPWTIALVPVAAAAIMVSGMCIGVLLVPINLVYRDIENGVKLLLGLLLFTVPVGYVPVPGSTLERIVNMNPVTPLLNTARDWMTLGGPENVLGFLALTAGAMVLLGVGLVFYVVFMPIVIERQTA